MRTSRGIKGVVGLLAAAGIVFGLLPRPAMCQGAAERNGPPEPATNQLPAASNSATVIAAPTNAPVTLEKGKGGVQKAKKARSTIEHQAMVVIGSDEELKEGESAEKIVVICGSVKVYGRVRHEVVAIGGNVEVDGDVGGQVVAILGDVKVGPSGNVHQDVVSVGGKIEVAEGAKVRGSTQQVEFPGKYFLPGFEGLKPWLKYCVIEMRPLAPQVGWVWGVAGAFLLLYFLITLAFPRPVAACVEEMTQRPATTFLMGLLTKLLAPLALMLLVATGVGVLAVPFIVAALLLGALLGKAALLQYLGSRLGGQFGIARLTQPLIAFLLGWILITLLYLIPILGLMIFAVTGLWGTGAAVMAAFGGFRRETPQRPSPAAPAMTTLPFAPTASPAPAISTPVEAPATAPGAFPGESEARAGASLNPPIIGVTQAMAPEALVLPRAGFWERILAGFLDWILVCLLSVMLHEGPMAMLTALSEYAPAAARRLLEPFMPLALLVGLAYFASLWAWRGTTVGGIVLNLKVVRHDGKPVNFAVALVRALAAAFSVVVLFLGFLWVAWSRDKQSWHDKIAGTVVVRQSRSLPLICI